MKWRYVKYTHRFSRKRQQTSKGEDALKQCPLISSNKQVANRICNVFSTDRWWANCSPPASNRLEIRAESQHQKALILHYLLTWNIWIARKYGKIKGEQNQHLEARNQAPFSLKLALFPFKNAVLWATLKVPHNPQLEYSLHPEKNNYTPTPTLGTSTKQKDVIKCKIIYSTASRSIK
jgi:hypothetical protein